MKRTPLKRKTRLNRRNEERLAKRKARDFGELARYIRTLDCCACEAPGPSQACHVKSRGAGGHAWLDSGDGNIIPMCASCHHEQHQKGWGAVLRYGRAHAESMARAFGRDFKVLEFSEKSGNESGAPW